jgi:epoxyqueuosine reductase
VPTAKTAETSASPANPDAFESLFEKVRSAGFPLVGAVDLDLASETFAEHGRRYADWIAQGYHGEMGYLERGLERRLDPRKVFPAARSVLACAIPYRRSPLLPSGDENAPRYARYLQGPDYHKLLPRILGEALEGWAESLVAQGESRPTWKICVDTSAVLERSWAALCGIGWIGKNTLLIHPQFGSYLFLAVAFIDRASGRSPEPLPNYCGKCTRCLEGCPTSAIIKPGTVDSRKCVSYLTLEKRGPWSLPEEERSKLGSWVAGCDICQEVCPFNLKPVRLPETWPSDERDQALVVDWERLANETEEQYRRRTGQSALSRIKYPDMLRNVENARTNRSRPADAEEASNR